MGKQTEMAVGDKGPTVEPMDPGLCVLRDSCLGKQKNQKLLQQRFEDATLVQMMNTEKRN